MQNDVVGRGGFNLPRPILAGFQKNKKRTERKASGQIVAGASWGLGRVTAQKAIRPIRFVDTVGWLVACLGLG